MGKQKMRILIYLWPFLYGLEPPSPEPPMPECHSITCWSLLDKHKKLTENYQILLEEKMAYKQKLLQCQIATNVDVLYGIAEYKNEHITDFSTIDKRIEAEQLAMKSTKKELSDLTTKISTLEKRFEAKMGEMTLENQQKDWKISDLENRLNITITETQETSQNVIKRQIFFDARLT